ncbi:threonine/serine exporter [Anaerolineae bacterium CFX9]|jgi:uncharacterized membrane protein YjjB (DUF3815 family)|nr:threonine/serine exporter [Anaerolineae bacterium CFX9]
MISQEFVLHMLQDAFWSALAALGFALVFSAPRRTLWVCALIGAIGHASRTLLETTGQTIEFGTFIAALIVGTLSWFAARRMSVPASIFAICGAIPLVPGSFAFRAMIYIIQSVSAAPALADVIVNNAIINIIKTAVILAALAAGISVPTLLFQRRRPVV